MLFESAAERSILLVEDDVVFSRVLATSLRQEGYRVKAVTSKREANQSLLNEKFDLVLLDLNLPDGTSYDLCEDWSLSQPSLPILFISEVGSEEVAVRALTSGAIDFIRKPFGMREIAARIAKVLGGRRGKLSYDGLVLDLDSCRLLYGGVPTALTQSELYIFRQLMKRPGEVIFRDSLLQQLDESGDSLDQSINCHVSRLRSKLSKISASGFRIAAVYGQGYRLEKR